MTAQLVDTILHVHIELPPSTEGPSEVIDAALRIISLADAVSKWNKLRDQFNFGASAMLEGCGDIEHTIGGTFARVSYNGRLWDMRGHEINL